MSKVKVTITGHHKYLENWRPRTIRGYWTKGCIHVGTRRAKLCAYWFSYLCSGGSRNL